MVFDMRSSKTAIIKNKLAKTIEIYPFLELTLNLFIYTLIIEGLGVG
jgi:hypothetical protein